jgi:hypothetical protein
VETSRRLVRNEVVQPAKPRRPSTPHGKYFASRQKCCTSLPAGADSHGIRRFKSNRFRQSHAESERCSSSHDVTFSARRYSQTVLHPGNLYGFPTAARGTSVALRKTSPCAKRSVSCQRDLASPEPFLLPVKRFPRKSDFILVPEHLRLARMYSLTFCRESRFVVNQSMVQ